MTLPGKFVEEFVEELTADLLQQRKE